jgi:hypothetical protein
MRRKQIKQNAKCKSMHAFVHLYFPKVIGHPKHLPPLAIPLYKKEKKTRHTPVAHSYNPSYVGD